VPWTGRSCPVELPICVLTSSDRERKIFRDEFGIQDSNYLIKPVNAQNIRQCPRVHDSVHGNGKI